MAEGGGTPGNDGDGKGGNGAVGGGKGGGETGASTGAVGSGTPGNDGKGGGGDTSNSTASDSDNAPAAPAADTTTTDTDPAEAKDTGYSFSSKIGTDLADTIASLSLSKDTAKAAALSASFGSMPGSFGSLAADTAMGHLGMSALQGTMAGFATHSAKAGLSVGLSAATNPAAIASALSSLASKGFGMDSTAHTIGGVIGSTLSSALGPVGSVMGGFLGTTAAELALDGFDARDNEMARDAMEEGLGPFSGRAMAASMSDLGFAGFNMGLNDPSMADLDGYTAGVLGQAKATADAAMSLGYPTDGLGSFAASFSDPSASINTGKGMSVDTGSIIAAANDALTAAALAPDRSGELGSTGITAASVDAQDASLDALGNNVGFTPTRSYGWLRSGLPVSAPSSPYRSSYWDGTRFVNVNDYRGFM